MTSIPNENICPLVVTDDQSSIKPSDICVRRPKVEFVFLEKWIRRRIPTLEREISWQNILNGYMILFMLYNFGFIACKEFYFYHRIHDKDKIDVKKRWMFISKILEYYYLEMTTHQINKIVYFSQAVPALKFLYLFILFLERIPENMRKENKIKKAGEFEDFDLSFLEIIDCLNQSPVSTYEEKILPTYLTCLEVVSDYMDSSYFEHDLVIPDFRDPEKVELFINLLKFKARLLTYKYNVSLKANEPESMDLEQEEMQEEKVEMNIEKEAINEKTLPTLRDAITIAQQKNIEFYINPQMLHYQKILIRRHKAIKVLKRLRATNICTQLVYDFTDYAVKISSLKDRFCTVPPNIQQFWKNVFLASLPIFPHQSGSTRCIEDLKIFKSTYLTKEANTEIANYLELRDEWDVVSYKPNIALLKDDNEIQYFMIQRVLAVKYPYPVDEVDDFPPFQLMSLVQGLSDPETISIIRFILDFLDIHVFGFNDVIDFIFDKEFSPRSKKGTSSLKEKGPKTFNTQSSKTKKEKFKSRFEKVDKSLQTEESELLEVEIEMQEEPKEETFRERISKIFFGEEQLPDETFVEMMIFYLKNLNGKSGWVFIDELTPEQILILEKNLTGINYPLPILTPFSRYKSEYFDFRAIEKLREPKLFHSEKEMDKINHSFKISSALNSFVRIRNISTFNVNENIGGDEEFDFIDEFYFDLGIFNLLYYNIFNWITIKKLLNIIIPEENFEDENSESLLKPLISYLNDSLDEDDVISKKSLNKSESSKTLKKKIKKEESRESKHFQKIWKLLNDYKQYKNDPKLYKYFYLPEEDEFFQPSCTPLSSDSTSFEDVPVYNQDFLNVYLYLPLEIKIFLATFWEESENTYFKSLEKLFLKYRIEQYHLSLYEQFIITKFKDIVYILVPEYFEKMQGFLMNLNNRCEELKDHFLEKLDELYEWLKESLMSRTHYALSQRIYAIEHNNFSDTMIIIINLYMHMMNIEMELYINSLLFINWYFINGIHFESVLDINKIFKTGIFLPNLKRYKKFLIKEIEKNDFSRSHFNQYMDEVLLNLRKEISMQNPFYLYIKKRFNWVLNASVNQLFLSLINYQIILEECKPVFDPESPDIPSRIIDIRRNEKAFQANRDLSSILYTWKKALNKVSKQFHFRLEVIKTRAQKDIFLWLRDIREVHYKIIATISKHNIIHCNLFDNFYNDVGMIIQENLRISLKVHQHNNCIMIINKNIQISEWISRVSFNTMQLRILVYILNSLRPSGVIDRIGFIHLCRDLEIVCTESQFEIIPQIMKELNNKSYHKYAKTLFGKFRHCNWKYFIMCALRIPPPSIRQLLNMRKHFRYFDREATGLVTWQQFNNVKLWYEKKSFDNCQIDDDDVRNILWHMYQTEEYLMDYMQMLFGLCKENEPIKGLTMALSLTMAKRIVYTKKDMKKFDKLKEESTADVINYIIDVLMQRVIIQQEAPIIEEIFESPEVTTYQLEKKRKKHFMKKKKTKQSINKSKEIPWAKEIPFHAAYKVLKLIYNTNKGRSKLKSILLQVYKEIGRIPHTNSVSSYQFLNHPEIIKIVKKKPFFQFRDIPLILLKLFYFQFQNVDVFTQPKEIFDFKIVM